MDLMKIILLFAVGLVIGWAGKAWQAALAEYRQLASVRKAAQKPRVLSVWVRSDDLQGRGAASMDAVELIEAGAVMEQDETMLPRWWPSKN